MVEGLIQILAVTLGGGLLMLERRCLGQMAFVQPLVVCSFAGALTGRVELGVWLGVSLQLFSVQPMRNVDWAVAGIAAAATVIVAPHLGLSVGVGSVGACLVIALCVLLGIGSWRLEKVYFRQDRECLTTNPPWTMADPEKEIARIVHSRVLRWFVIGAAETFAGTAVVVGMLVLFGMAGLSFDRPDALGALAIPILGTAVAIAAAGRLRYVGLAGIITVTTLGVSLL